jgi:tetratricopeptide (TPR) repeat protein
VGVGRIEEAIATFEGAMRYEPKPQVGPIYQLAMAYYLAGRYRDAVSQIDMGRATRPEVGEGLALRAAALAQLGELEAARRSAAESRRLNPHFRLEDAGTRLMNPEHALRLREGLAKAGL